MGNTEVVFDYYGRENRRLDYSFNRWKVQARHAPKFESRGQPIRRHHVVPFS